MFVTSGITFNENRSEVAKLYISVDLCRREEGGGKSCQGAAFHTRWVQLRSIVGFVWYTFQCIVLCVFKHSVI